VNTALNAVNSSVNRLGTRVGDLETDNGNNIANIERIFADLTRHQNLASLTFSLLTGRVATLESSGGRDRADILSLISAVEEISGSVNMEGWRGLAARVDIIEVRVNGIAPRIDTLEGHDAQNRNSITDILGRLTAVDRGLDALNDGHDDIVSTVERLDVRFSARIGGIDVHIDHIKTDITNIKWSIEDVWNRISANIQEVNISISGVVQSIKDEARTRQSQVDDLTRALQEESADRRNDVSELNAAIESEAGTRRSQVDNLNTAIENEAILRNQQITQAIGNEAAARESQINEVNNAITNGFAELNGQIQATNNVLDGIRTTSLHGAFLTRALGGTTDVPVRLFGSFTNFQAGKTLVFDDNGTQGVFIGNVDSATIRVTTKSISHMSDLKPTLLGSVATRADLPEIAEEAAAIFGRTPSIDDHVFVLNDETHDDLRVIWYVMDIVEIPYEGDAYGMIPFPPPPPTIVIVWGNPIPINRDDFQAQTAAVDSGLVLTGGATPGTFGESMAIDLEATEGSDNLITSDAVYQAMERMREENSFSPDEVYTGTSWIDGRPIFRKVMTGETGTASPTTFGFIENLGSFVDVRGHVINPYFIDNITTVDINFQTGELRGHWPEQGVINTPVWNWWNVGSPTINFAASGSHNNINGLNVGRLGGAAGGIAWGPAGFAMGGNRFTIGAVSPSGTTETTPSMRIAGVLDFTMPTLLEVDFGGASGAGAFQVSINNNTISMANSVHGNASRVVNQTMSGSGTFQHLIDTREWTAGRQFLDSATITLRGEGTLTMQIFAIRLLRRTSWENSEFNLIFEYTKNN